MIITAITTRNLTVLSKLKDCLKIAKFTCRTNPLGLTELLLENTPCRKTESILIPIKFSDSVKCPLPDTGAAALDMIKGCLFTTAFFYEREHKKRARPYIRTRFFDFFPLPSDKIISPKLCSFFGRCEIKSFPA